MYIYIYIYIRIGIHDIVNCIICIDQSAKLSFAASLSNVPIVLPPSSLSKVLPLMLVLYLMINNSYC